MQVEHSFSLPLPVAQAWDLLLDVDRVAPCFPGATVESYDGEVIGGRAKVKLGPIQVNYSGTVTFVERDESARRITVEAKATETRGVGTALATMVAVLQDAGPERTQVAVTTELSLTGRPAQFSRGVLVEVGSRLLNRFSDCLAAQLAGGGESAAPQQPVTPPLATPQPVAGLRPELGSLPVPETPPADTSTRAVRRLVPVAAALVVLLAVRRLARRR